MVMWLVEKSDEAKIAQFIEQNSSRLTERQTEKKKSMAYLGATVAACK